MSICTENPPVPGIARTNERRAGSELLLEHVFRPLADAVVPALVRARVPPPAVVLANAAAGLCAALAVARGEFMLAALLLQLKTVLDNADGLLARTTGRVTLVGRYLDTEADLVVNAAVFAALGYAIGQPWLALVAFLALTTVLAVDFNISTLYQEAHGEGAPPPLTVSGGAAERALGHVYSVAFAPQDRIVRAFSTRRLERLLAGASPTEPVARAYNDHLTTRVLANFGLSTQLAALGVCLALDMPATYLYLVVVCLFTLPPLQLRRERLARKAPER